VFCQETRRVDLRLCELDHAGSEGTDVRSATAPDVFRMQPPHGRRPHNGCRVRGRSFHPGAIINEGDRRLADHSVPYA